MGVLRTPVCGRGRRKARPNTASSSPPAPVTGGGLPKLARRAIFAYGSGTQEQLGVCAPYALGWFDNATATGAADVSRLAAGGAARRRADHRGRPLGQVGACDRVRGGPHLLLLDTGSRSVRLDHGSDPVRAARSGVGRSRRISERSAEGLAHVSQAEHTGRCLCGAVGYRAIGEPKWIANCHCASCRRATGAPLTTYAGYPAERICVCRGRASAHSFLAGRDPGVLRALRHAAHLRGRPLAGRGAHADRQHRPARGPCSGPGCVRRGEAALGAYGTLARQVSAADGRTTAGWLQRA